jgi:hypothetical protein
MLQQLITACVTLDGPSESEAGAILKINLTAIAKPWLWMQGPG